MLRPIVQQKQYAEDFNRIRLDDLTPAYNGTSSPGGYGTPNIARAQVDFVDIKITAPDGNDYSTGPLHWSPANTSLDLYNTDFTPYLDAPGLIELSNGYTSSLDCAPQPPLSACQATTDFSFKDGLYTLTYEVWGKVGIPAQITSYHLALDLCDGQQVWVSRQGSWVNITKDGQLKNRLHWSWSKLNTPIVYEYYEVRYPLGENTYRLLRSGSVQKVITPSPAGDLTTSESSSLVGSTTIRFLLTGVATSRIAKLALRPLFDFTKSESGCDTLTMLAVSRQQLDTLKSLSIADETAPVILNSIVRTIDLVEKQFQYSQPDFYFQWQDEHHQISRAYIGDREFRDYQYFPLR